MNPPKTLDLSKIKKEVTLLERLMAPNLIEEHIYLGDEAAANSAKILRDLDIKRVLTVFNDVLENHFDDIIYKKIPVEDFYMQEIITYFPEANEFLASAQKAGHNVLVHCHMGVSRSATIVIAFLMNKYRIPFRRAFDLVKKKRDVCPNSGFVSQLSLYERMGYTLNANNRCLRRILSEFALNPESHSFWSLKRKNSIENYFKKLDLAEKMTENLELGNRCLCSECGFQLFHEIHIVRNDSVAEDDPKKVCQWTYIEPQKWMKYLFQEFDTMTETTIQCPECNQSVVEFKWEFLTYICGCVAHKEIGRCLRFRIENSKFKIETNDQKKEKNNVLSVSADSEPQALT